MATLEDTGSLCQSLIRRATSAQSSDWTNTSATAVSERWNRDSWQRLTASLSNCCSLQLHDDETPEVVNLRRLIAEQNATLDEWSQRIEATEQQIEEYERCIHNDRCAKDGYDYLQRAYNLMSSYVDDENEEEEFASRYRTTMMEDTIAVYYTQASNEIRQRLIGVQAQLVDIANNCGRIASAECDDGKDSGQVDEFDQSACCDVDQKVQLVVSRSAHRRHAFQLDALRLELARADDVRRQQLVEHHRLSSAIRDAQSQLDDEELRLAAMLATCDEPSSSSYVRADIRKSSQPLTAKAKNLQTAEQHRHVEKDRRAVRQSRADGQVPVNAATILVSSASDVTQLIGCQKNGHYGRYNVASKSREIYACSDTFASDSDAGFGSLPDDDDLSIDCHRLVTLV